MSWQHDDQIFKRLSVGQRLSVDLPTPPSWFAMTMNILKRYSVDVL